METYIRRDSQDTEAHGIFCENNKMFNVSKQQQHQRVFEREEEDSTTLENKNIMETYNIRRDSQGTETHGIFCENNKMFNVSKQQQHQRVFERNIDKTLQLQKSIKIIEKRTQHVKCPQNIIEINLCSDDDDDDDDVFAVKHLTVAKSSNNIDDFNDRINSSVERDLIQADSNNNSSMQKSKVFLKPGKPWTRSLSILKHLKEGVDLNELNVGKGNKWRQSVKEVMDMQKDGIWYNCSKKKSNPLNEVPKPGVSSLRKDNECNKTFTSNNRPKIVSIARIIPSNISSGQCTDISFLAETSGRKTTTATKGEYYPEFELCKLLFARSERGIHSFYDNYGQGREYDVVYNKIRCRTNHVTTAKDVLRRSSQECFKLFSELFPDSYWKHCRKIGESIYGEIFLYQCEGKVSVIEIIPVDGESQKKFSEILSEIDIAEELYKLRDRYPYGTDGFVELKSMKCIVGRYPPKLIKLWNKFNKKMKSDNDCPSVFDESQLYIVLELEDGGEDLQSFVFEDARETCAIFVQLAFTLAIAEKALQFEHRDMHWGNILISRTNNPYLHYTIDGEMIEIYSYGIKVSIIDFTLSRMYKEGRCTYNNLALNPSLFTAHGDYQYEVYRLMREKIENNWQKFEPYTNILWLYYTVDKMITAVSYKKTHLTIHKQAISRLRKLKHSILNYNNTFDFVTKCNIMTRLRIELK